MEKTKKTDKRFKEQESQIKQVYADEAYKKLKSFFLDQSEVVNNETENKLNEQNNSSGEQKNEKTRDKK